VFEIIPHPLRREKFEIRVLVKLEIRNWKSGFLVEVVLFADKSVQTLSDVL